MKAARDAIEKEDYKEGIHMIAFSLYNWGEGWRVAHPEGSEVVPFMFFHPGSLFAGWLRHSILLDL